MKKVKNQKNRKSKKDLTKEKKNIKMLAQANKKQKGEKHGANKFSRGIYKNNIYNY